MLKITNRENTFKSVSYRDKEKPKELFKDYEGSMNSSWIKTGFGGIQALQKTSEIQITGTLIQIILIQLLHRHWLILLPPSLTVISVLVKLQWVCWNNLKSGIIRILLLISYNTLLFYETALWFCLRQVMPPIIDLIISNALWFSFMVLLTMGSYIFILWLIDYCPHDSRNHTSILSFCHSIVLMQNSTWLRLHDHEAKNSNSFHPYS